MSTEVKDKQISLGYKLKKAQHALRLHMDDALKEVNLTTPQYAVLSQLELETGLSNAELARRSFITAQTMHGIVANLEKRGLIKRINSMTHGRILSTALTDTGRNVVRKSHDLIKAIEKKMTSSMDQRQIQDFDKMLSQCLEKMGCLE